MEERIVIKKNNNFWQQEELYKSIDNLMLNYHNDVKNYFFIETAKQEGWFGWHDSRCDFGFCGFMRTNLLHQVVILNKLDNPIGVPANHSCFSFLFKSDWFQNSVLQNGFISFQLYPKWCLEVIKTKNYYQPKQFYENL
jgi:hypothetical protein